MLSQLGSLSEAELPDEETYRRLLDRFWWDIVYVPKALARDELSFAKCMLEANLRHAVLEPLIRWYIVLARGRAVDTGVHGRWFKALLPPDLWRRYGATFAGAGTADNWHALFATIEFTREVGKSVSERLDYHYPSETDALVSSCIRGIYERRGRSQERGNARRDRT